MRKGYFYSLIFALCAGASVAAIAAPAVNSDNGRPTAIVAVMSQSTPPKTDLNSADAATLQRVLAGVGEAKAKAIVAYRESNGPFATIDELLEVKGIGQVILDRNRENLEVN